MKALISSFGGSVEVECLVLSSFETWPCQRFNTRETSCNNQIWVWEKLVPKVTNFFQVKKLDQDNNLCLTSLCIWSISLKCWEKINFWKVNKTQKWDKWSSKFYRILIAISILTIEPLPFALYLTSVSLYNSFPLSENSLVE